MDDVFEPSKNLSINESTVLWRLVFRRCIKNKRHKYGVKNVYADRTVGGSYIGLWYILDKVAMFLKIYPILSLLLITL